jgi:hypothetical protein
MTSFRNTVNTKTLAAGAWKAQEFPYIATHLAVAE